MRDFGPNKALPPKSKSEAIQAFREFASGQRGEVALSVQSLFGTSLDKRLPNIAVALGVTAAAAVLGGLGAHRYAPDKATWFAATLLALVACGMVVLARRYGLLAGTFATIAAATYAALNATNMETPAGTFCTLHELITGALALGALVLSRGDVLLRKTTLIGVAAAGALAGDATLHVTCPGTESLGHTLVFHVGGVVAAGALLGTLAARILGTKRVAAAWF